MATASLWGIGTFVISEMRITSWTPCEANPIIHPRL
jgi:hypothetical protein